MPEIDFVTFEEACKELACREEWIEYLVTGESKPLVATKTEGDKTLVSLAALRELDQSEMEITTPLAAARYGCNRQYIGSLVSIDGISSRKPGRDLLVKLREVVQAREGRAHSVKARDVEQETGA